MNMSLSRPTSSSDGHESDLSIWCIWSVWSATVDCEVVKACPGRSAASAGSSPFACSSALSLTEGSSAELVWSSSSP
jgi:hypothetical protein